MRETKHAAIVASLHEVRGYIQIDVSNNVIDDALRGIDWGRIRQAKNKNSSHADSRVPAQHQLQINSEQQPRQCFALNETIG